LVEATMVKKVRLEPDQLFDGIQLTTHSAIGPVVGWYVALVGWEERECHERGEVGCGESVEDRTRSEVEGSKLRSRIG